MVVEDRRIQRATATGLDQVLSAWDAMNGGFPYFAVWYNKQDKYFQYNGDNIELARDFLKTNLEVIADQGDNAMYYLKIYPTSQVNYTRNGEVCAFPFRLNPYNELGAVGATYTGGTDAFAKLLTDSNNRHIELVKEIAELKAANQPLDWFDRISGLLETPGAANAIVPLLAPIIGALTGAISKVAGVPPSQIPQTHRVIAGPAIPDGDADALLDLVLDRLEKHGDLLEMLTVLANFADTNPAMFKMYFDGLKSQQQ